MLTFSDELYADIVELRQQTLSSQIDFDEDRDCKKINDDFRHGNYTKNVRGHDIVCFDGQYNIQYWISSLYFKLDDIGVEEKFRGTWLKHCLIGNANSVWEELQDRLCKRGKKLHNFLSIRHILWCLYSPELVPSKKIKNAFVWIEQALEENKEVDKRTIDESFELKNEDVVINVEVASQDELIPLEVIKDTSPSVVEEFKVESEEGLANYVKVIPTSPCIEIAEIPRVHIEDVVLLQDVCYGLPYKNIEENFEVQYVDPVWSSVMRNFEEEKVIFFASQIKAGWYNKHELYASKVQGRVRFYTVLIFLGVSRYLGKFRGRMFDSFCSIVIVFRERFGEWIFFVSRALVDMFLQMFDFGAGVLFFIYTLEASFLKRGRLM